MAERPILFSAHMVRAIMEGRKTQTRRIMREGLPFFEIEGVGKSCFTPAGKLSIRGYFYDEEEGRARRFGESFRRPPAFAGDRLWVRETHYRFTGVQPPPPGSGWVLSPDGDPYKSRAYLDTPECGGNTGCEVICPSIFMPRWASRLTLEITGVRVQRLQEISEGDILAEGVTVDRVAEWTGTPWSDLPTLHDAWRVGWDSINGVRAPWASNPWVWVIDFEKLEGNPRA